MTTSVNDVSLTNRDAHLELNEDREEDGTVLFNKIKNWIASHNERAFEKVDLKINSTLKMENIFCGSKFFRFSDYLFICFECSVFS